jgi:hypothetical protein
MEVDIPAPLYRVGSIATKLDDGELVNLFAVDEWVEVHSEHGLAKVFSVRQDGSA